MVNEILLMTGSIYVDRNLRFHHHISTDDRLKEYINAFIFYITKSNFKNIIYIDGNDYEIEKLSFLIDLGKLYGKKLNY